MFGIVRNGYAAISRMILQVAYAETYDLEELFVWNDKNVKKSNQLD